MARKYTPSTPTIRPDRAGPPITTPGNTRAFDMRPKPINDPRRSDPRQHTERVAEPAAEGLLDDPAE